MSKTYTGSCHCGAVAFEATGDIERGLACNCSMCGRRGSILWFVPRANFRLTTPEANARVYTFNKHVLRHVFCPTCGIHTHGEGTDPKGNAMTAVNLRCVDGLDLEAIPVTHYDGRSK